MAPNDTADKPAAPDDGAAVYESPEVGRMLNVSGPTLRKAIRAGVVPAPLRLGRRVVWPKAVIDGFLSGAGIQTAAGISGGEAVRTAALRTGH